VIRETLETLLVAAFILGVFGLAVIIGRFCDRFRK